MPDEKHVFGKTRILQNLFSQDSSLTCLSCVIDIDDIDLKIPQRI